MASSVDFSAKAASSVPEGRQTWSLRQRMTGLLFGLVLAIWGLSAVVIYFQAEKESQELFDASIAETASLLLFLSEHELAEVGDSKIAGEDHPADDYEQHYLSFQLWDYKNQLRYRSVNAPVEPLAPLQQSGFGWQERNGEINRTFNKLDKNNAFRIIVSEPLTHRTEITNHFFANLAFFSLFMLPSCYLGVRWVVRRALAPVDTCAQEVANLDPRKLQSVSSHDLPREISPLVDALNKSLNKIRNNIDREKRFTADAAHELRTPLAGVKTNVQMLAKHIKADNEDDRETLQDALTGIDRCSRMITQLLSLSQSESSTLIDQEMQRVSLPYVIDEVVSMESDFAQRKQIKLSVNAEDSCVFGYRDALILLVRNLVNNAITYNQPGGTVTITCRRQDKVGLVLSVQDDGPGIPEDKRKQVFDRFFRLHPSQTEGTGLGLSICSEIASLHGTRIDVREGLNGGGVGFSVTFKEVAL